MMVEDIVVISRFEIHLPIPTIPTNDLFIKADSCFSPNKTDMFNWIDLSFPVNLGLPRTNKQEKPRKRGGILCHVSWRSMVTMNSLNYHYITWIQCFKLSEEEDANLKKKVY